MRHSIYFLFISFLLLSSTGNATFKNRTPKHDSFTIDSKIVSETRVINVWTPPKYNKSQDKFPVIYMPDGGIKEDFPHIANTIAKLIKKKKIPPIILVGIENTERRRDLTGKSVVKEDEKYCPLTNGSKNFRFFIAEELIPEINKKYRTTNKKGIIGESLAGLFVIEMLFLKPETFDFYIAMDPSLWWNDHYLVRNSKTLLRKLPNKDMRLWFAGSSAEDISIYTNAFAKVLQTNSPDNLISKFSDKPQEQHNTIFRASKEEALIWILNEK